MATDFEDLTTVETEQNSEDYDDVRDLVLEDTGDEFVGEVRHIERNVGKYDKLLLHLTVDGEPVKYWCQNEVERKIESAEAGPGDIVGVRKGDGYTFTNDDGEEITAHDYDVGVSGGDD